MSLLRKSGMRKAVLIAVMLVLLLFVASCGNKQMQAKPLKSRSPTGAVAGLPEAAPEPQAEPADESSGKTAAEALKEFQAGQLASGTTGAKTGSTGMPPAPAGLKDKEALAARTHALYDKSTPVGDVEADRDFGTRFKDLPDEYANSNSAGDD